MVAIEGMRQKRLEQPGRYTITIDCADDMSEDELILMKEWFVAEVFGLAMSMGIVGQKSIDAGFGPLPRQDA